MHRKPTITELRLIEYLMAKANIQYRLDLDLITVANLNDSGMGSLRLYTTGTSSQSIFGSKAADHQFKDSDGVDVIASLYLHGDGQLFELDVWKTDFSRLLQIPDL